MNLTRSGVSVLALAASVLAVSSSGVLSTSRPVPRPSRDHQSTEAGSWHPGALPVMPAGRSRTAANYVWHLSGLERWDHFPLSVAFVHDSQYSSQRQRAIVAGFRQWARATRGETSFDVVDGVSTADVVVRCDPHQIRSVTETRFDPDNRVLVHANVTIGLSDPDDPSTEIGLEVVQSLAAHEFGHALGIDGHSNDPRDLMYPTLADNCAVSTRDLNTLRMAYPTTGDSSVVAANSNQEWSNHS